MRRLIILISIGAFLTTGVAPLIIHKHYSKLKQLPVSNESNERDTRTVCETEECNKMSKLLLDNMNKFVDPCNDFYGYACGRWVEHNPIPEEHSRWNAMSALQKSVNQQVVDILESTSTEDETMMTKVAKTWYAACMDTDGMEERGLGPLIATMSRIGGWPMIMEPDEWDEHEYSWQKVDDHYMRLTGRNSFHDVRVNEEDYAVHIDTPHLPPGSHNLRPFHSDKEEHASKEDPSDEDKQSDEDNQDPGSEGEDKSKNDKNNIFDDNEDEDSDDVGEDSDDVSEDRDEDDTNEGDEDRIKKKVAKKKTSKSKIGDRNNRKLKRKSEHERNGRIIKHSSHKTRKQRIKRRAILRKLEGKKKRARHVTRREKIQATRRNKSHAKRMYRKKSTNVKATHTLPMRRINSERENNDVKLTMRQQYVDYVSKVARVLAKGKGTEISQEHLDKDVEDLVNFQLKLIKIIPESTSIFDFLSELDTTLDEFQEWYDKRECETAKSKIDWVYKISCLFDEANVPIDRNLDIEVGTSPYFEALISLLDKTPSRTIVNYIHWNFVSRIIITTTNEMRELYNSWKYINEGNVESRTYFCTHSEEMQDILGFEFVRRYFPDEVVRTASNMLNDIQKEVENLIKGSTWMDDDSKKYAIAKLTHLKKIIGYPNWYRNATIIDQYLQGLVVGKSFYENALSYVRFQKWKGLRKATQAFKDELDIDPKVVNAYFIPIRNALSVSAADFQSPFFAYNRPDAINFGIIGFMMAHEVNHGFDDSGYLYDKDGYPLGWLTTMADTYDRKADCFVEQFNYYPIDAQTDKKIKDYGNQTISDNIADTMGLQAIFKVYQRKENESGKTDPVLPGMEDITNNQLFFLSFANLWCEAFKPDYLINEAKTDEHSTGRLRVIGSVSNSMDFAKAYNCPTDSPMNPEKKCNIWE